MPAGHGCLRASEARKPALSVRKLAARAAVVQLLRATVPLSQTVLAPVIELSQPVVGDVLGSQKPAHLESIVLLALAGYHDEARAAADALVDLLRDIRGGRVTLAAHDGQLGTSAEVSQRVQSCAALKSQPRSFTDSR